MKKRVGKLELHRETVRSLTAENQQQLKGAAGGTIGNSTAGSWTSCVFFGEASCQVCPQV